MENKEDGRKRKKQFLLCLSEHEMMMLEQKAYEFNITKTECLTQMILFGRVQKSKPRIDEKIIIELVNKIKPIGNRINQIARRTNTFFNTLLEDLEMAKEEVMKVSRSLNGLRVTTGIIPVVTLI